MRFCPLALLTCPIAAQNLQLAEDPSCSCTGVANTTSNDALYICNNDWLGPQLLPWRLPLLSLVSDYNRFGSLTPLEFLQKHWFPGNETVKARWKYPPYDGFLLDVDNRPIKGNVKLPLGYRVDRFGGENGSFVSAADAPFSQRSLPPDALNVCKRGDKYCEKEAQKQARDHPWAYHIYEVAKEVQVVGGPIAPGFEQPGGGIQFDTGFKIFELVNAGYLKPLNLSNIHLGPGVSRKCETKPVNCTCQSLK